LWFYGYNKAHITKHIVQQYFIIYFVLDNVVYDTKRRVVW